MSIFDKIMKKEHEVEKMSCNCQQVAEEWIKEQEKEKEEIEKEKATE